MIGVRPSRPAGVPLAWIAAEVRGDVLGDSAVLVTDVHHDSRLVAPGDLFVARGGARYDGVRFVEQAVARGAVAVLAARDHAPSPCTVPLVLVDDVRAAMAHAAELVHGRPSRQVKVFGITGTNGKTTTVWLLEHALRAAGHRPGVLGTYGARLGEHAIATGFNTPEADELTRIVAWMVQQHASHVLLEMTSIALDQRRTDGLRTSVAALTHLTQDHLDYHGTMDRYGAAKARLFFDLAPERAVVMVDDEFGRQVAGRLGARAMRVSRHEQARADVRPLHPARHGLDGLVVAVQTPCGVVEVKSPLFGAHNLSNVLLALGSCVAFGLDVEAAARAIQVCPPPPGRLERCDGPDDDILAFVDYAHTPDGLVQMLASVRMVCRGRLICVFGCGGDRDRTKRGPMGRATEEGSDVVVLTSDNPRSEDPGDITAQILAGMTGRGARAIVELDRLAAIDRAVSLAKPGDVVVVAGKGHEREQIVGTLVTPWDDSALLRDALRRRRLSSCTHPPQGPLVSS
jgi:UDP-N-acetylmuramoyl-L-alanyl-D-glutamate--2,6-diaminopimelate ligase